MDPYVTGAMIRQLREEKGLTQSRLAEKLAVTDKCISRWETGKGYPDITLLEPLAQALGISVPELMRGSAVTNANRGFNMRRLKFCVCPVCGNILMASGEAVISCCGIPLMPLEAEAPDEAHAVTWEKTEDEYFVTVPHEMTKTHYISFLAAVDMDSCQLVKLYPEGNAEARFPIRRAKFLYYYCNRHGLYKTAIK